MKSNEFYYIIDNALTKYKIFQLHLSKASSNFLIEILLEHHSLTSTQCQFGSWYFSNENKYQDMASLKAVEQPYIRLFSLYRELEDRFNLKLNKVTRIKNKLPFVKNENDRIQELILELNQNCIEFITGLEKVKTEISGNKIYNYSKSSNQAKNSSEIDILSPIHKFEKVLDSFENENFNEFYENKELQSTIDHVISDIQVDKKPFKIEETKTYINEEITLKEDLRTHEDTIQKKNEPEVSIGNTGEETLLMKPSLIDENTNIEEISVKESTIEKVSTVEVIPVLVPVADDNQPIILLDLSDDAIATLETNQTKENFVPNNLGSKEISTSNNENGLNSLIRMRNMLDKLGNGN